MIEKDESIGTKGFMLILFPLNTAQSMPEYELPLALFFSRIRAEYNTILFLYGKIRVRVILKLVILHILYFILSQIILVEVIAS